MSDAGTRGEVWKVQIDLELAENERDRVTLAIQKAVLAELSGFDLPNGYAAKLIGPGGRGRPVERESEPEVGAKGRPSGAHVQDPTTLPDPADPAVWVE